jgi:stalled ribosome alternative rescue factor ArfA
MKKNTSIDKKIFKKSPEELQLYLHFKKRGFKIENKKGKGSYVRRSKHVGRLQDEK